VLGRYFHEPAKDLAIMACKFEMPLPPFGDAASGHEVTAVNPAHECVAIPYLSTPDFGHASSPA